MPGPLAGLSYRTRLTLAMIGAALLPLLVLAVAVATLTAGLRDEADRRLAGTARAAALVAADGSLDAEAALRLAQASGFAVALYDADGIQRGTSDASLTADSLADPRPSAEAALTRRGGTVSAAVPIGAPDAPRGYLVLAAPE